MRVLALTNLYPTPFHPTRAPFNRHQFRLLAERHPVQVICPVAWTEELSARRKGADPLPAGRRVTQDGLTVDHPRYWFPPRLLRGWYGHCFERSVRATFARAVREFRPDLVFAPWAYPDGWAAVRLAHAAGLPAVLQVHGSDVLQLDEFPARRRPTAAAVRAADAVVAVSRDIADHLIDMGVRPENVRVIIDGVDPAVFCPGSKAEARERLKVAAGDPLVLYVGNLVPVKAVDVLLEAARLLVAGGTAVRLVLVGGGPLRADLEQHAARLGLADRVRFTGAVPQVALPDWYRAADVFVLPSHSEGVPNVLLEASACGTPWVASRVGGIPEIAHFGVSRLVPPATPPALAAALRDALLAPPAARPPGPRPRQEAVADLEDWLAGVLARRPHEAAR